MIQTNELAARLHLTAERIVEWRADAARLRAILRDSSGPVSQLALLDVEETSGDIYREIAEFDALLADIDRKSHAAAGQIAEIGDALRLVLMEITELGTKMYPQSQVDRVE
jgi:hypothetical protein